MKLYFQCQPEISPENPITFGESYMFRKKNNVILLSLQNPGENLLPPPKAKHISFKTESDTRGNKGQNKQQVLTSDFQRSPDCQNKAAAPGCIPKVHIIADYVM